MPSLAELAAFVDQVLDAAAFPGEPATHFVPSERGVRRLGFALEPWPGLAGWVDGAGVDAVFLHRPWRAEDAGLPADVGVLASHAPFDHRLTVGCNPDLAHDLHLQDARPFGEKEGRTIGMMGDVEPADAPDVIDRVVHLFGGVDEAIAGRMDVVRRIAVAGGMTDALIRDAAARGAELYLTGQLRQPGLRAVAETGIGVVAVGHARGEEYGLRLLAGMMERRFAGRMTCIVRPRGTGPAHLPPDDGHPPAPIGP